MFLYKIDIHTVIIKETVLWNIVRWHCKTVVYVSMLCSTEPTKKHSVLMSLLVNGEDPPTGYSVRKPQQHQVRSWVSLTLRFPLQKKKEGKTSDQLKHIVSIWLEMIWYVTSWLFPNYSQTMDQQKKCFYVARIIHVLFTMADLHFLKEMLMLLHAKKKKSLKKTKLFLL